MIEQREGEVHMCRKKEVKRDGIRCRRIGMRGNVKQIAKEYARYHE